jgi:3-isopropylmalate/(R)-2-methylmalate dehydratase large subunit
MAIEAGARAGMVAADEKTIAYLRGARSAPKGATSGTGRGLLAHAVSDAGAQFDRVVELDAAASSRR